MKQRTSLRSAVPIWDDREPEGPSESTLVALHQQGRFPFDRLVKFYELDQIEQALEDSASGDVIKPILRVSQ